MLSKKLTVFIENLKNYRDGLIVIVSFLYICGYLSWAFLSWRFSIGPVPAIDVQYFAAGIPMFVIGAGTFITFKTINIFYREKWPSWIGKQSVNTRRLFNILGYTIMFAALFHGCPKLDPKIAKETLYNQKILYMILLAMLVSLTFIQRPKEPLKVNDDHSLMLNIWILILSLYTAYTFITVAYIQLPQEFGGARPRCAQLDITPSALSRESIDALSDKNPSIKQKGTFRTRKIFVLFSGSDRIIAALDPLQDNQMPRLLEIKQSTVNAITWCR